MTNMMTHSANELGDLPKVATLSVAESTWRDDIKAHTALASECVYVMSIQEELMERQRRLQAQVRSQGGLIAANVPSDPTSKTIPPIAVANDSTYPSVVTTQSQISQIEVGLVDLDNRLRKLKAQMHDLEGRILTHEPNSLDGVRIQLEFISDVLAMDHKIDLDYLSEVMACCAQTMSKTHAPMPN